MTEPVQEGTLVTESQEQTTQSWYPDDYKDVVATKKWKEPVDVLKSYTELEKALGQRVKLPTPQSSAEEISAFYAKIGRPENPDGYEIKVPDGIPRDENIEASLKQAAFESGVPKAAFESLAKKYYDSISQQMEQSRTQGETALKSEWKDKYDANLEVAKRFAREGGDEFIDFLDKSGLGNNPVVVKAFYNYGTKILDDSLIKGSSPEKKDNYIPKYPDSPSMYVNDDTPEGAKAREWFKSKGIKF